MTLPSVEVVIADVPGAGQSPTSIGTLYAIGYTERGGQSPVRVTSMNQFRSNFGSREPGSTLYDAAGVFFREGGDTMIIQRIFGPTPATASVVAKDATAADTMRVDAKSPGEWGNDLQVNVTAPTGTTFALEVVLDGETVETSPRFANTKQAVDWSVFSSYVTVTEIGTAIPDPIPLTMDLTGGTDDRSNVDTDDLEAALDQFSAEMGPGQVAAPGITSPEVQEALLAHAYSHKRNALLDFANTSVIGDVVTAAESLQDNPGNTFSGGFWPWDTAPGESAGTIRNVAPSARNAALFARAVRETGGEVGQPPAGGRYPSRFVNGLTQLSISDQNRELLNDSGVNVSITRRGQVLTYGNRTLTDAQADPVWSQLNQSRVIASLAAEAGEIGADYVHGKIDGQGLKLGEFAGRLQGLCADYYRRGDLYGVDADSAFTVTSEVEIEGGGAILLATIDAVVSPGSDKVRITIFKSPIS